MMVEQFLAVSGQFPDTVAIEKVGGRSITYRELRETMLALAAKLNGETIGLCFPRSADFVAALLATWTSGKVALIMDPEWPDARAMQIRESVGPSCVLRPGDVNWDSKPAKFLPIRRKALDPAYLIFTSGSTGYPKGAVLPHAGLVPVLDAQITAFKLRPGSRSYWMHGVAFDASLSDIGTALLSGATLVIDREIDHARLLDSWRKLSVTHADLPPALLPHITPAEAPRSLETIIVGGQVCDAGAIRRWTQVCRVVNVYGPTEATICTSLSICDPSWDHPLIGQPIAGMHYTIDEDSGELSISGSGVALGYHQAPDLTSERFSGRTFHTRDRVKRHADGEIEFLGRLDRQVKIHGRLVHPEEVERAVSSFPGVHNCVVCPENGQLAATLEGNPSLADELSQHLAKQLPVWMIPTRWNWTGRIELTSSGKLCTPRSGTEILVSEIFAAGLDRADFGLEEPIHDSLAVIRALVEAEKRGLSLSASALRAYSTVRSLADAIGAGVDLGDGRNAKELDRILEPLILPSGNWSSQLSRQILLTGATGFFGSAILGELLTLRPELEITCLVRGGDKVRVDHALANHGFSGLRFDCVAGDLCQEIPAIPADAVIHVAAEVSLAASFEDLFETNVLGAQRVLEFAKDKALHYISTLSVFVDARPLPPVCLESDTLENTEVIFGGYAQSKWAAERLVRASRGQGQVAIYRPGLLTANSQSDYAPSNDWFESFLSEHDFADESMGDLTCDFTPVNHAARQAAQLILRQTPGTYHLANPQPMRYRELAELAQKRKNSGPPIAPLALRDGNSPLRVFKTTGTRFCFTETEALLHREIDD